MPQAKFNGNTFEVSCNSDDVAGFSEAIKATVSNLEHQIFSGDAPAKVDGFKTTFFDSRLGKLVCEAKFTPSIDTTDEGELILQ